MTELQLVELQDWGRNKSRSFMCHYNEDEDIRARSKYNKAYYEARKAKLEEEQAALHDYSPDLDGFQVFEVCGEFAGGEGW